MTSIATSPGKVILFGEHFVVYGTKAILASIDKRVKVSTTKIPEKQIKIKSNLGKISVSSSESFSKVHSLFRPFVFISKKLTDEFGYDGGLEIVIESDIPSGIGLGSSSACCVAAAGSISREFTEYSKERILELAIQAEKTIFRDTSGADCTVCTFGGIIEYKKETGYKKFESNLDLHLIIANSKIPHSTREIVSKVNRFKQNDEDGFSSLCDKESSLVEQVLVSLEKNDLIELGKSMSENQRYLEMIGVSSKELQSLISQLDSVTFGSKITGAGGGGCIIALTSNENLELTIKKLKESNIECFSAKIDFKGLDTF